MFEPRISRTQPLTSPRWTNTTKLVVGLSFAAILAGFVIRFREFVGPLILAFMVSYLLYPVANRMRIWFRLPWRLAVTLIYALGIIIAFGLIAWGGLALVEQLQSLVNFGENIIKTATELVDRASREILLLGPFVIDLRHVDLGVIGAQSITGIQPVLSGAGSIVTSFASSTMVIVGWLLFVWLISYFLLAETEGVPGRWFEVKIPGYQIDIQRMQLELGRIWNAFLRGQVVLMALAYVLFVIFLGVLGLKFYYFLALLGALSRLVPYVGPWVAWTTYGVVAFSQSYHPFGLTPIGYALVVVGFSLLIDQTIDNFVSPRIMADALQVHPAAMMVAALMMGSFLGIIGIILAAPVLATLILFSRYAFRKMIDLDPWEGMRLSTTHPTLSLMPSWIRSTIEDMRAWLQETIFTNRAKKQDKES